MASSFILPIGIDKENALPNMATHGTGVRYPMTKTALITGIDGMVGSYLATELNNHGIQGIELR